jgi:hypothetical protein
MALPSHRKLLSSVRQLTGNPGRHGTHVDLFPLTVRSSEGKICRIVVSIGRNKKVYRSTLNQIADTLRIDRRDIERWLEEGTHEQLVARLERYPADVLESLAIERRFREFDRRRG